MSFDSRIGLAGLLMALIGVAVAYLWPDKKWIGWTCCCLAGLLIIGWSTLEIRSYLKASQFSMWLSVGIGAILGGVLAAIIWLFGITNKDALTVTPTLFATATNAEYPIGTVIGNISWSRRFGDCRISIVNESGVDFAELDITLHPDEPVAAIGQVTTVSNVVLSPAAEMTMSMEAVDMTTGKRRRNPLTLIATTGGYRLQCPKLSRKGRIEIVMAITKLIDFTNAATPSQPRPDGGVFDREYVIKLAQHDGTAHWYGHGTDTKGRIEEVYKDQRFIPKTIQVNGRYTVAQEERVLVDQVKVHDLVGEAIPQILEQFRSPPN
jgi:hypothetical protein